MSSIVQAIVAILVAIPKLKELWDQAVALYVKQQLDKMREADREAIRRAMHEHDQRLLEKQLFGKDKSQVSGLPNTELRDSLPGVLPSKKS